MSRNDSPLLREASLLTTSFKGVEALVVMLRGSGRTGKLLPFQRCSKKKEKKCTEPLLKDVAPFSPLREVKLGRGGPESEPLRTH